MKMIPKKCSHPLCDQVFMISSSDFSTKFHASYCKQDFEMKSAKKYSFEKDPRFKAAQAKKEQKCLDMVNSGKMELDGLVQAQWKKSLRQLMKLHWRKNKWLNHLKRQLI